MNLLPIPKELQNQKAIPFMEWCVKNAILTTVTENGQIRENYFEIPEYFLNFYNQPFTPEMLEEYFEGWKKDKEKYYYIVNDIEYWVNKFIHSQFYHFHSYHLLTDRYYFEIRIRTLGDLITLCNLAGVELTWKGETE